MYVGKDYDEANPGEQDVFSFNFAQRLAAGETLTGTTWSLSSSSDPSAPSRLIGSPAFTAGGITTQVIDPAIPGVYLATATVTTSASRTLIFYSRLPTKTPS